MAYLTDAEPLFRDQRRRAVINSPLRVGLDYVIPRRAGGAAGRHADGRGRELWDLELHFLPGGRRHRDAGVPPVPESVSPQNLRITLGEMHDPGVRVLRVGPGEGATALVARLRRDPSTAEREDAESASLPIYTVELVDLPQVDRFFSRAVFAFHDGGLDLGATVPLPLFEAPDKIPEIDYLAKDYDSFRRLLLERMKEFVPSWHESHAADLGVTVVELLAYAADYLSYYQDAAATEAYLATARRRISVRRHARLVDYRLHEGTNARCWVQFQLERVAGGSEARAEDAPASESGVVVPGNLEILTYSGRIPGCVVRGSREHLRALERKPLIFRALYPTTLYPEHDEIEIYTWRAESFTLPRGATSAALVGHLGHLRAGDVLIFERRREPRATDPEEVDPRDRQAVRLCKPPVLGSDLAPGWQEDAEAVAITEVEWFPEDALQEELPVSARIRGIVHRQLAMARANLLLVDHGETHVEILETVPDRRRYEPSLLRRGLAHCERFDDEAARIEPAAAALRQDPRRALPDVELFELNARDLGRLQPGAPASDSGPFTPDELRGSARVRWTPRHDLLGSGRFAHDFVVELDDDGTAHLRFGDDRMGQRPSPGTVFAAIYRVGLGPAGNVGAYALRHAVIPAEILSDSHRRGYRLVDVKNHLAGGGGREREPVEQARLFAPQALHSRARNERCVTAEDYAEVAERHPDVVKATARLGWDGGWNVAEIFVQRALDRPVDELLESRLRRFLEPYLLAGWKLRISSPLYVPLDVRLTLWPEGSLNADTFRARLRQRVATGAIRLLQPGDATFGKSVYLSEIIAEVMKLPEISDVRADVFQRWGKPAQGELEAGEIPIRDLEIAQLDNDPAAPHRGTFRLSVGGLT